MRVCCVCAYINLCSRADHAHIHCRRGTACGVACGAWPNEFTSTRRIAAVRTRNARKENVATRINSLSSSVLDGAHLCVWLVLSAHKSLCGEVWGGGRGRTEPRARPLQAVFAVEEKCNAHTSHAQANAQSRSCGFCQQAYNKTAGICAPIAHLMCVSLCVCALYCVQRTYECT